VVTAAVAVMLLVAAAALATTVGLLVAAGTFRHRYDGLAQQTDARPDDINHVGTAVRGAMGVLAVGALLVAVVTVLLAIGVFRGGNGARIGTWALVAFGLLCACSQCVGALSALSDVSYTGDPERIDVASQLTRAVQDALPGWLGGLVGGAAAIQALGYILVAVLLGLPPANRYFRGAGQQPLVPGGAPWPPHPYPMNPSPTPASQHPASQHPASQNPPSQNLPMDPPGVL
jgi:hypothetical protein